MKEGLEEKKTPKKKKKDKKGKGSRETSFQKRGKRNVHSSLRIAPRQRKEKGGR